MREIKLSPNDQKQLEAVLLKSIRDCNNGIKKCLAEGNGKGASYIREVKRRPLIKKLADVRRGVLFE